MTRALAATERTRPAPGDMPDLDDDARHRRWVIARFQGVDPRFRSVTERVAPDTDLAAMVRAIFDADRAAGRVCKALWHYRAPALKAVRVRIARLGTIIEMVRQLDFAGDEDLPDQAIADIAEAHRGVAPPELGIENHRIVASLIAKREALQRIEKMLDGRGSPPSRLRIFADQIAPVFARFAQPDRRERSDFREFLVEAARLATGSAPGSALAGSVARALFK